MTPSGRRPVGLKDKNGRDICDRDIVEFPGLGVTTIVSETDPPGPFGGYQLWRQAPSKCVILGNIHENPELFKQGGSSMKKTYKIYTDRLDIVVDALASHI